MENTKQFCTLVYMKWRKKAGGEAVDLPVSGHFKLLYCSTMQFSFIFLHVK